MPSNLINTNIVWVNHEEQISAVVRKMIDGKISSVLVCDGDKKIVGILTERDIVHKFTLLDLDQKWSKKVKTIMTRGVVFAQLQTLKSDLVSLHFRHGFRHFPVLIGPEPVQSNVMGMVTVTDLCKEFLLSERRNLALRTEQRINFVSSAGDQKESVHKLLSGLGYLVNSFSDMDLLLNSGSALLPLVIDVEGRDFIDRDNMVLRLRKYPGDVIVLNDQRPEHGALNKFCSAPGRTLLTKPIDVSYLNWILASAHLPGTKVS